MLDSSARRAVSFIERERVRAAIEEASRYPIILTVASAGFGKSIAIRQFLDASKASWIRYGVTFEGSSLPGFTRGLVDALLPVAPGLQASSAAAIAGGTAQSPDWIATTFREHLCRDKAEVFQFLTTLIERSPAGVRWILAVRHANTFPVASWTVYNRVGHIIDEQTLRFTETEAVECARLLLGHGHDAAAKEAFSLTGGWPAAYMLALRSGALGNLASDRPGFETRQMIYDYLAEQVFRNLSERQRQFLLDICHYKAIDIELLLEEWEDAEDLINELRRYVPFLHFEAHSIVHVDGLFADFLQDHIASQGKPAFRASLLKAAVKMDRAGRASEALPLYIRAGAYAETIELLTRSGMALVECGRADVIERALASVEGRSEVNASSALLLLQALMAAYSGNFARCDALFERAIEFAPEGTERVQALHRYALELIRRNRRRDHERLGTVVDALIASVRSKPKPSDTDALVLGTVATGCAIVHRIAQAQDYAREALRLAHQHDSPVARATLYHQASFVALAGGDAPQATSLSAKALDLAGAQGLHGLAARCHSVRYSIWVGFGYEPDRALAELTQMIDSATKAGDAFLTATALAGSYAMRVESGESDELDELRAQITENPAHSEVSSSAIASADAMRAAWSGQFREAFEYVQGTAEAQITDTRRGLRWGEIALYAAACGERDAAIEAVSNALALTRGGLRGRADERRRFAFAHGYCALACIVIQQFQRANTIISEVEQERRELGAIERAITQSCRAVYLHVEAGESIDIAIAHLREAKLGGLANVVLTLPFPGNDALSAFAALTKTEIAVLREITRGATNAKIAKASGRSTNTVNAHVASILRKLNCRTRQDAAEYARKHGL